MAFETGGSGEGEGNFVSASYLHCFQEAVVATTRVLFKVASEFRVTNQQYIYNVN